MPEKSGGESKFQSHNIDAEQNASRVDLLERHKILSERLNHALSTLSILTDSETSSSAQFNEVQRGALGILAQMEQIEIELGELNKISRIS